MKVFTAKNNNDMAVKVYSALKKEGVISDSRNGPVLMFPTPITMRYTQPWYRANFTPGRDANPFFHIAESMWMLAGRKDVEFLSIFNANMDLYSDNGYDFNAAYGFRMREHFHKDQLVGVVDELEKSRESRQAVIQLWDSEDLGKNTKDKACNMLMVFSVNQGKLQLTVYNRSNDLVYGNVTGANPIHFSYIQQWVSDQLKLQMGDLYFVSNNAHVYMELYPHWKRMIFNDESYLRCAYSPLPDLEVFEQLCKDVVFNKVLSKNYRNSHIDNIVVPILNTFLLRKYKSGNYKAWMYDIGCPALKQACMNWVGERHEHN